MRKTLNIKRLSAAAQRDLLNRWLFDPATITNGDVVEYPTDIERPKTRGDCVDSPRPCPWVSCREHLALDVSATGSIKMNFPGLEVWQMNETCALDVVDRYKGGAPLLVVAAAMGLSFDRTFQVIDEAKAHAKVEAMSIGDDEGGPWEREKRRAKREQVEAQRRIAKKQGKVER